MSFLPSPIEYIISVITSPCVKPINNIATGTSAPERPKITIEELTERVPNRTSETVAVSSATYARRLMGIATLLSAEKLLHD